MGIVDNIKDLYYSLEDKYYALLDKINNYVPIHAIIDPIDRIVPSFLLVIGLIVLLIVAIAGAILLVPLGQKATVTITVLDEQGNPIRNADLKITGLADIVEDSTNSNGQFVLYDVPVGITLSIRVEKQFFDTETVELFVDEVDEKKSITLASALPPPSPMTIEFVGPSGTKLVGVDITADFSCTTGASLDQPTRIITTGEVTITPPVGCGNLSVSVVATGYQTDSFIIDEPAEIINLQAESLPKGGAVIIVKDIETQNLLNGIKVTIYNGSGVLVDQANTDWGEASFQLEIGSYSAVVEDESLDYGTDTVYFNVSVGRTISETVRLSKQLKATINVEVVDKDSLDRIANANVYLRKESGEAAGSSVTDENGSIVSFALKDSDVYYVSASAEDYLTSDENRIDIRALPLDSQVDVQLQLERCTALNCGRVIVRVLDEDQQPVENAAVSLFDPETDFWLRQYGAKDTNSDGYTVAFTGVKAGSYYALAQKYPASGTSEEVEIDPTKPTEITVNMFIGEGIVELRAEDLDGNPVPFATAELKTEAGELLGTIALNAEGIGSYFLKADKRVYAIVSSEDYTSWVSVARQIYPDETVVINATLEEEILGTDPEIALLGIFNKDTGSAVQRLNAGGTYIVKLQVRVPSEEDYEEMGIHARTGQTETIEKDQIFVNYVNAPNTSIIKSTTYTPPTGTNVDEDNLTNGDAKWVNIVWDEDYIEPGIYNAEVELKVRQDTTMGYELPFHYRTWAVSDSGYLRDPVDAILGNAESVGAKHALYAITYDKLYYEGVDEVCDEYFCFGQRVYDVEEGLYLNTPPYRTRVYADYDVWFSVTNNSPTVHDNADIRIKNTVDGSTTDDVIFIEEYKIINADATEFIDTDFNDFEIPDPIYLGHFIQNKSIIGEMGIDAKKLEESNLQLIIVSDGTQVFEGTIMFQPIAEEDLNVTVMPDVLAAYIDIDLLVRAEYEGGVLDGFPVEDALVRVTRITPDRYERKYTADTNAGGYADFSIPASSPGTKIVIDVEKPGFGSTQIVKEIGTGVLEIEPEVIESQLNLSSTPEEKIGLKLTNLIPSALEITNLHIRGRFMGLLDEERMNNWLQQYVETVTLRKDEAERIQVLVAISDDAYLLNDPIDLEGTLAMDVSNLDHTATWAFTIPMEIEIGLTEPPEYEDCLIISIMEWKDSTLEARATKEFTITNNCVTQGTHEPMTLRDLQARLDWSSDIIGQVELTITDPATGGSRTEVLQESLWAEFFGEVEPEKQYIATAVFTPKPNQLGNTAKFKIEIDAEILTDYGEQFVGASNDIDSEIMIVDLQQCVEFSPHPQEGITIPRADDSTSFDVINNCGPIALDIRFCDAGRDNCRGGATEGGIYMRPWTIDNLPEGESRTVTVERDVIPGFYGITVDARPPGGSYREIATMELVVEPKTGKYFTLDRYDFTIIGEGAKDSTTLFNGMYIEDVDVRADLCAWDEASSDPNFMGAGALGGAALGAWFGATQLTGLGATISVTGAIEGGLSVLQGATLGMGIGLLVGIAIALLLAALLDEDCHDEHMTETLSDFVINLSGTGDTEYERYLPPDAIAIMMDNDKIGAEWNLEVRDVYEGEGDNGLQEVGVVFENLGIEEPEPVYAIATFTATEHVHGDATHAGGAYVDCDNGNFGQYWIGGSSSQGSCDGAYDKTHTQKFHLRFKTMDIVEALPDLDWDTYACVSGTEIGRSGSGALPTVKFNWSWNEPEGIGWNSCDSDNEEYVYCDATQFTIELNKKLYRLYEFLEENNFEFSCPPEDELQQDEIDQYDDNPTNEVAVDSIGLSSITHSTSGNSATFTILIQNNTTTDQNATVTVTLTGLEATGESCTDRKENIAAGSIVEASCTISSLAQGAYLGQATIDSETTTMIDSTVVSVAFYISGGGGSGPGECWLFRSTETYFGEPVINQFIRADDSVEWTTAIPNLETLNDLLRFNAYLIKDGYSQDFRHDFVRYYSEEGLAEADSYFTDLAVDSNGESYGFNRLFERDYLGFSRKYVLGDNQLPSAGLYEVELAIYFGDDWRYFDDDGNPIISAGIIFYHLDDPYPNSPFYSMPFDGMVGLEGEVYNRQGYGMAYDNESAEKMLNINEDPAPVKTYEDGGSNPIIFTETSIEEDFYELNTSPDSRGAVLIVERSDVSDASLTLQPSFATPVMLKMHRDEITDEEFSAFYVVSINDVPVDAGNVLAYWDGAGSCLDFTGVPVYEAFYQKPDRAATEQDWILNWLYAYAVDWSKADYAGDVYLRTIFYSNPFEDTILSVEDPMEDLSFLTPDSSGTAVGLNGISTMEFNNFGGGTSGIVDSIEDVFNLVESSDMCITNTGNKSKFWWNPQSIYEAEGLERSIHDETQNLVGGVNCIGYS